MACQDITKFGIFDLTSTSIDEGIVESLRHWVKSNHFQTQSDAHQAGFGLGVELPIDEIPIGVNADGTYGDSHSNNWSDAFESELKSNSEKRTQLVQVVKKANADIVNAWAKCEEQPGFKCWATQPGNSHDVVLKMIINRPTAPFNGARIKEIVHSDNVVVAAGEKPTDKIVVSMSPIAVLYKRVGPDADMPVTFLITTTDANYSGDCEVIGLPISRVELLKPIFDPQRTGYARLDPQTGLVTVAPGTVQGSPCTVGFKIVMEEGGRYSLVVEYATDVSRPCDVLLNAYDAQGQPVYPDYLTFVANLATAVTIVGALAQPTGGFGPAYLRSTTVGELELRKGLNTIHIRRRGQGEPGYKDSGNIPDIRGIKLLRQVSLKRLPETHTAWLQ